GGGWMTVSVQQSLSEQPTRFSSRPTITPHPNLPLKGPQGGVRKRRRSRSPDVVEEAVDLGAEGFGLHGEFAGGREHLRRRGTGLVGGLVDADDIRRNLRGAGGRLLNVARDFLRGHA